MRALHCVDVVELVTDYVEGALPPRVARRFERHVAGCAPCLRYVDQVRATRRALGSLPVQPPAADVRARLLAAFRARRGRGYSDDHAVSNDG